MNWTPEKNPTPDAIASMILRSRHRAARKIMDARNGDVWCWPAEQATHAVGAARLGILYDAPAGVGEIITLD